MYIDVRVAPMSYTNMLSHAVHHTNPYIEMFPLSQHGGTAQSKMNQLGADTFLALLCFSRSISPPLSSGSPASDSVKYRAQNALDKQLSFLRQCRPLPLIWLRPVLFLDKLTPDQSCGQRAERSTISLRPCRAALSNWPFANAVRGIVSRLFIFTVVGFRPSNLGEKLPPSCCYSHAASHGLSAS